MKESWPLSPTVVDSFWMNVKQSLAFFGVMATCLAEKSGFLWTLTYFGVTNDGDVLLLLAWPETCCRRQFLVNAAVLGCLNHYWICPSS